MEILLALKEAGLKIGKKKIESLELAKQYVMENYFPMDTILFINTVGFGGINSRASFTGSSRTYKELVSTGNLSLILNDSIRNLIVNYYNNKDFIDVYINNVRSDFANYFNALRAFNPKDPESINTAEIPRILKKI